MAHTASTTRCPNTGSVTVAAPTLRNPDRKLVYCKDCGKEGARVASTGNIRAHNRPV